MIKCTLTPQQLDNLYKHLYASMKKDQQFDPMVYMKNLYSKIVSKAVDEETGKANAVKFLQNVPRLMMNIAMEEEAISVDLNQLKKILNDYKNVESGFGSVINQLGNKSILDLNISALKDLYAARFETSSINVEQEDDFQKKPLSAFTTTYQQLQPDKNASSVKLENLAEERKLTYAVINTIAKIIKAKDQEDLSKKVIYTNTDGTETSIKLVVLTGKEVKKRNEQKSLILPDSYSATLTKSEVQEALKQTPAELKLPYIKRYHAFIADENGNILYFNEDGDIVPEGLPIFTYLRGLELTEEKELKAIDYAGSTAVADPYEIASTKISVDPEQVKRAQQAEFKKLQKIQQEADKKPVILNIDSVSSGVILESGKSTIAASDLAEQKDIELSDLLNSDNVQYVDTNKDNLIKGQTTVNVLGEKFVLERPSATVKVINDIIEVFKNSKIPVEQKVQFYNQFFPQITVKDLAKTKKQSHTISFKDGKLGVTFFIDLNKAPFFLTDNTLTQQQEIDLRDALENGNRTQDISGPALMHYSQNAFNSFLKYEEDTLKVDPAADAYTNFLISLNPNINTISFPVNPYINFSEVTPFEEIIKEEEIRREEPIETTEGIENSAEEVNQYLENLKALREELVLGEQEVTDLSWDNSGKQYSFLHPSLGRVVFMKSPGASEINLEETAIINNEENEFASDGIGVAVYQNGEEIGWVRETNNFDNKKQEKTITSENIKDITKDEISLDRSKSLDSAVSPEQNKEAETWFSNSPLSKFIQFEHLKGVVNSDAFAKFIIDGSVLASPYMLAKIKLFGDGNMVDVYHEAWHGFSQLFLTKDEKLKLYEEVRNSNSKYKNFSLLELEELLAEDFRSYALNQKILKNSPTRNSLFRRIWNFIKALFGKVNLNSSDGIARIPAVKELYDNLYFASNKPELLNKYKSSIENVLFTELNRAKTITSVSNKGQSVMSNSDSILVSESIDSYISDLVDFNNEKGNTKAYTVALLRQNNRNKLYEYIKNGFQETSDKLKETLSESLDSEFNTYTTEEQLVKAAPVVIIKKNGTKVYGFVSSQISDLSKLVPNIRKGARVRGQKYFNINIVTDFYEHSEIKDENGNPIKIIVGNSLEELRDQYLNYKDDPVAQKWESIEVKDVKVPELTNEQIDTLNQLRVFEKALANWGDGDSGVIAYHLNNTNYQFLNAEKYDNTAYTENNTDEEGNEIDITDPESGKDSEDFADRKVGKKSVWDTAHPELKYIISSLHVIDKSTNKPVLNSLGFKKLADSHYVWSQLLNRLENKTNEEEMYSELLKMQAEYNKNPKNYPFPEIKQLLEKMPSPEESIQTGTTFDTLSALYHTFNKYKAPYLQVLHSKNAEGQYDTKVIKSTMQDSIVLARWINTFETRNPETFADQEIIYIDARNRRKLNLENVIKVFGEGQTKTQVIDKRAPAFLRALGLNMDNISILNSELVGDNSQTYGIPYIYNAVKAIYDLKTSGKITEQEQILIESFELNPVKVLSKKFKIKNREFDNTSNIKKLATLQATKGIEAINSGVPNAAGETVYPHIDYNTVTRIGAALQKANNLSELMDSNGELGYMKYLDPVNNPYTTRLKIIQSLFNTETGKRRSLIDKQNQLLVFMYSGTQIVDANQSKKGKNTTDLSETDFINQNINAVLLAGVQEILRVASKKTSMGMKYNKAIDRKYTTRTDDAHLYIDLKTVSNSAEETAAIEEILIPHLAGEFDRIRTFKKNRDKYKNYIGYNREIRVVGQPVKLAGEVFTAFDGVLKNTTKDLLYNLIDTAPENVTLEVLLEETNNSYIKDLIISEIKNYFNNMTKDVIKVQGESLYISPDILKRTGQEEVSDQKFAAVKAFNYNSWIHNFETAILIFGDFVQYDHAKEEMHKRTSGATSNGPGFRNSTSARQFINEKYLPNSYAKSIGINHHTWEGVLNTSIIADVERPESIYLPDIKEGLESYYKELNLPQDVIKKLVAKDIEAYTGMKEGDGAGYITLDSYRILKKLENDWSEPQEELFKQIIKGEKLDPNLIKEFYSPYKLQTHGHLQNDGLPALAMHKFALFPLIPGMIENSDLESLHRQMLAKGINYVTFASGSKGASISSNGKPDQIYSKDGQFIEDIKFTPNQIRVEYVKKSSSTNSYFKKVVTYPTQKRGLLLNHLYEQGFAKKGLGPVATAYQDAVAEYSNIVRLELLDEIEYTYNPETNTYTGNHTKFVDLINRTLEERDVPKHLLETITTDLKGNLSNDLSYHISADKIEKLLTSLIEKRLIKQNVVGEPLIQMPSSMFNGIWDTSPEIVDSKDPRVKALLGTNNLAFYQRGVYDKASKTYGKTAAMHISIALQGPFKNLLKAQYKGEEIGTIDRLNEAIKDQQWFEENQSLVTIVGDRIPIQDHGSLEFARIWHFLPESMTNVVVVPTEIVAKAGSDFDVDKIFWQFPEINKEGKLFESTLTDTEISELMVKDPVAGKKALAEKKKSVNNKLIQANIAILSHPDIYAYLIKPNNTYLWEDIAKELEVYYEDEYNRFNNYSGEPQTQLIVKGKTQRAISPSKTLEPLYQAHKLGVNMVGKDGLGVVALANKIHPILVSVGARMNAKHYEFDSKSLTYTGIEHPLNLMFDYNKTEDGAISLSHEYNSDKNKIADLHSHLMNGLVDVEKDAWVFYVRANIEQLPVLLHLSEAGVNQEVIAKFLTQPLLRQYITQSGQISGMYYELKRENEKIKKWEIFGKLFEQTGGEVFTERVLLEANKRRLLDAAKLANDTKAISLIETASELTKLPRINHNGYTFKSNENIGNKNLLPYVEQILMEEVNVTKFTNKNLTNNLKEPNPVFDLLALTHYLKAEYQSKDYHEAKQMFNPDTKVSKTATASYSRAEAFNEALKNPNIHKDTLRRLKEESVLKSFFNNDIAINLLKPMFTLRLNNKLLDYVLKMQSIKSFQIRNRFNNSKDYKDLFNSSYSNAVISYIWQNSMSYMLDENGRRTSLPKVYGSFDIVINNSISEVTALEGSKLFVNTNKLNEVFSSLTVSDPKAPVKDKETFAKKEIFPNVELLTKFYLELAVQRTMYPNKSKQELIKRALIFSFNPHAMLIDGYSKKIMELVQQNKLQTKFSVLNLLQIAEYPSKKGFSVLTLADNRNINGDLATEFASQLSQLADETVSKVSNKALNYEISEYFKIFSEVLLYQHGSGYSMNGINNVLNVKKITELLDAFGNTFINTELSKEDPAVLDEILKNVLSFDPIHNYTNIKATPLEPIIETEEPEESIQGSTSVKTEGVEIYNNNGLTIIENGLSEDFAKSIVPDLIQQIESQSYKQTKSASSYDFGLRWTRMNDNLSKDIKLSFVTGMQLSGYEITKEKLDRWVAGETGAKLGLPPYGYNTLDQYGKPLAKIPASVILAASNATGIDLSTYQASYNSVYDNNDQGSLIFHQDNTEQLVDAPIVTLSLGLPMKFVAFELKNEQDFTLNNQFIADPTMPTSTEALKNKFINPKGKPFILSDRTVLVFDGKNRNVGHKIEFDSSLKGRMPDYLPEVSVNKAFTGLNQKDRYVKTKNYRTVLTLRKVTDDGKAIKKFDKNTQELVYKNGVYSIVSKSTQPSTSVKRKDQVPTFTIFESRNIMIDYTEGQIKALSDIQNLIDTDNQGYYLLAGYAGTGKTTIAENIARYAQLKGRDSVVLAPTNKAAKVLNDKLKAAGVKSEASTIHKAIYGEPNPLTGEWVIGSEIKNSVLIIDESSMISKELMEDLMTSTKRNNILIFMGDSFQLEPVGEDSGLFKGKVTEVKNNQTELTEVKRQSLDSNVLKVATLTRIEKKPYVPSSTISDFKVTKSRNEFVSDFKSSIKNNEDAVMIVATNNERVAMNNVARNEKFGEKINSLNKGDVMISVANSTAYPNSEIFEISNIIYSEEQKIVLETKDGKTSTYDGFFTNVITKDGKNVTMLHMPLLDKPSFYHAQLLQYARKNNNFMKYLYEKGLILETQKGIKLSPNLVIATYGYAVTAHKSQGSQWAKVFVNQNYVAPSWNSARWYYTAITRSSKDVIVLNTGNNVSISEADINKKLDFNVSDKAPVSAEFDKKNIFTVTPQQGVSDNKAKAKASIATQYIGFGEGITGSSTETYRQQAGAFANTGNYSSSDVIFVSIGGKRPTNNLPLRKSQQDRTIREAVKALETGATLITDNVNYIHYNSKTNQQRPITLTVEEFTKEDGLYNEGEKRLYENLKAKGYNYSEKTIDGQLLGVWSKPTQSSTSVNEFDIADNLTPIEQNFADGQGGRQMQDKFKGKSTMDLIISGDRTRTTRAKTDIQRMTKDYGLSKISDLVGKVIRMTDNTGRQVYTRITNVVPFTQEYQDATWQNEGWEKSVTDKHVGNYPYAIEFKVIDKSTQPTVEPVGEVKEGVSELFESNPTLAQIGTPQQYSQYLDTIFPDSKVKNINYHGTEYQNKIEKFNSALSGSQTREDLKTPGFWFTYNKNFAEDFGDNVISVVLNIKNTFEARAKLEDTGFTIFPDQVQSVNKAIKEGYDSAFVDVLEDLESGRGNTELVVFEPEQIHILGSKQDIEGFKEFVDKESLIEPEITLEDQNNEEDVPGCTTPF